MRYLIKAFLICVFSFLYTSNAIAATDIACGVEETDEGQVVKAGDFSICEDDLAYQVHNLLYSEVVQAPFWRALSLFFVDEEVVDSKFNQFVTTQASISAGVTSLISGAALIGGWVFFSVLAYKLGQFFWIVKKTGEFKFSEEKSDVIKFVLFFLTLVILMIPVGRIVFGQGLLITAALPAIKLGNFFASTYLNVTALNSADVNLDDQKTMRDAQQISSEMVGMAACEHRTKQLVFTFNAKSGSEFITDNWLTDGIGVSTTQKDINTRYDSCLGYVAVPKFLPDGVGIKNIGVNKTSPIKTGCEKPYMPYEEDSYGYNHSCGNVSYTYPTNVSQIDDWGINDELESIQSSFDAVTYFTKFLQLEGQVTSIIKDSGKSDIVKEKELIEIYKSWGESTILPVLLRNEFLNRGSKEQLSAKYVYATNALLGGSALDKGFVNDLRRWGVLSPELSYYAGIEPLNNKDYIFGFDALKTLAYKVVTDIQKYNCTVNWDDYADLRQFIVEYNLADEDDTAELLSNSIQRYECMQPVPENNSGDHGDAVDKYFTYMADGILKNADVTVGGDGIVKRKQLSEVDKETIIANPKKFQLEKYYQNALIGKQVLTGYIYAVKMATSTALSKTLREDVASDPVLPAARQKGFAALGSVMMTITGQEGGGATYKNILSNTMVAHAEGDSEYYYNLNAFGSTEEGLAKAGEAKLAFNKLDVGELFTSGGLDTKPTFTGDYYSEYEYVDSYFDDFMRWLEGTLFSPLDHIKKASGIPDTMGMTEGLKSCSEGNYQHCVSSSTHPMVAMMRFGHELMSNMLVLATADLIVKKITHAVKEESGSTQDSESNKKEKDNIFKRGLKQVGKIAVKVFGGALNIVIKVIEVASVILELLRPFVWGLFAVGVFFAYVVPLMSTLLSIGVFVLWVAGTFASIVILPFYCAKQMFSVEFTYKRGFNELYEDFGGIVLKPAFLTISVIFAFLMISICLFIANTIFGIVYDSLAPDGGFSISHLIMKLMVFVIYFVVLFALIKYGLDLIKSLPLMFEKMVKLNGSKDSEYLGGMGFEQYLQTNIMQQVAKYPFDAANKSMSGAAGIAGKESERREKELKENMNEMKRFLDMVEKDNQ